MAEKLLGIDIRRTTTTPEHELGVIVEDCRGGGGTDSLSFTDVVDGTTTTQYWYPDGLYQYVKAGSAISAGNTVVTDVASSSEPYVVTPCSAVAQVIRGIAPVAIASGSYGFVKIRGRVRIATNTGTISAGNKLGTTATAGALAAIAQADSNFASNTINAIIAMAAGLGVMALDSNDSNAADLEVVITN